jgi:hypothetical protein
VSSRAWLHFVFLIKSYFIFYILNFIFFTLIIGGGFIVIIPYTCAGYLERAHPPIVFLSPLLFK